MARNASPPTSHQVSKLRMAQKIGTSSRPESTTLSSRPLTWSPAHRPALWFDRPWRRSWTMVAHQSAGSTSTWEMRAKTPATTTSRTGHGAPSTHPATSGPRSKRKIRARSMAPTTTLAARSTFLRGRL